MNPKLSVFFGGIVLGVLLLVVLQIAVGVTTGVLIGDTTSPIARILGALCLPGAILLAFLLVRPYWPKEPFSPPFPDVASLGTWLFWLAILYGLLMSSNYLVLALAIISGSENTSAIVMNCMTATVVIVFNLLLASGGYCIAYRKSYGWGLACCCLAMIPLLGPFLIVGVPLGIWGLVVLRRTENRAAFTR